MPREEVVSAYLRGEISRRTFIRRLVATGVSVSAAAAYVQLLTPEWARAGITSDADRCDYYDTYDDLYGTNYSDHYCEAPPQQDNQNQNQNQNQQQEQQRQPEQVQLPPPDTLPPETRLRLSRLSLTSLLLTGRFVIRLTVSEACTVAVGATVNVPGTGNASAAKRVSVGRGSAIFRRPGTKKIVVKLSRRGKSTLRRLRDNGRKPTLVVISKATDAAGNVRTRTLRVRLR